MLESAVALVLLGFTVGFVAGAWLLWWYVRPLLRKAADEVAAARESVEAAEQRVRLAESLMTLTVRQSPSHVFFAPVEEQPHLKVVE